MGSELPFNFPSSWEVRTLGQIAIKVGSGATPQGGAASYLAQRERFALVRSQNVFDRSFSSVGLAFISDEQAKGLKGVELKEDDLLLNITGDGVTFSRACMIPREILPACVNQHVSIIRVDKSKAAPGYVLSYLTHPAVKSYIESFNAGGSRRAITKGHIESFEIPLPPVNEQYAISDILRILDDKIELNRQMNATLEAMAQALFKSWFVDFDPVIDNALAAGNPIPEELQSRAAAREALGDKRKPLPESLQNQFPDRFVHTEELGWVPEGWEVKAVNQVITVNPTVPLRKGTFAKYVDMKALPTTGYSIQDYVEKQYSGGAKFQLGDVLVARITPCLENGKTGVVDFLQTNEAAFGSTEFIVFRPKNEIKTPFIACLARHEEFRLHCIQNMIGSSGRQRVETSCFDSFYLPLATEGLLRAFNRTAAEFFARMTAIRIQTNTLTRLRDTLLPKLLSGELKVGDASRKVEAI